MTIKCNAISLQGEAVCVFTERKNSRLNHQWRESGEVEYCQLIDSPHTILSVLVMREPFKRIMLEL